jgi:hypothetical protein
MAQGYQFRCSFSSLDSGNFGYSKHISLFDKVVAQQLQRFGIQNNMSSGPGESYLDFFATYIYHAGLPLFIKMG